MTMRSWGARLRMVPWRSSGEQTSPSFFTRICTSASHGFGFFSAFSSNQTERCFNLSFCFQIRAESWAGADRNTDKENPTHSFTNLIADPASTRRLRRCMVRVILLVKTGRRAITVSLGQIGRGAHLGTGMRRRPIYFPFFFQCESVHGLRPGRQSGQRTTSNFSSSGG